MIDPRVFGDGFHHNDSVCFSTIRRFHEQDDEAKKWYTREYTRKATYSSNFDLYSAPSTNWRNTFNFTLAPDPPQPEQLPAVCRYVIASMKISLHQTYID